MHFYRKNPWIEKHTHHGWTIYIIGWNIYIKHLHLEQIFHKKWDGFMDWFDFFNQGCSTTTSLWCLSKGPAWPLCFAGGCPVKPPLDGWKGGTGRCPRWWQLKYFCICTPKIGEDEPILTSIFFKGVGIPPTRWVLMSSGDGGNSSDLFFLAFCSIYISGKPFNHLGKTQTVI